MPERPFTPLRVTTKIPSLLMTLAYCQASWHPRTIEYRGARAPQIQPATDGPRGTMPRSRHRKNAAARPHHPRPKAVHARAGAMTHHDSLSGDHNPKMTHHDSPPGDENPPMTQNDSLCNASNPEMTQNDSLCHASNPEMTQNDSLCHASMTQMTQNDSHFEVFSFEMTQNDSFSALKCPTEPLLSPADEPPATPPSPQNDTTDYTPGGDPNAAGHPFATGPLVPGHFACRFVLLSMTTRRPGAGANPGWHWEKRASRTRNPV